MSMPAPNAPVAEEREDVALNQSFANATNGTIKRPNILQRALFPRLLSEDTGLVVPTAPGAGRLEGVFVPSMTLLPATDTMQRLFVIGPDRGVFDDYAYRLIPYIKGLAAFDGRPRTVFFADDDDTGSCIRYNPDGSEESDVCHHPFDSVVDLVVTRFSEFRSLFFGSGGIHGLPASIHPVTDDPLALTRRDLFYFDDVQSFRPDETASFARLIEFLFAEDLDVVIGTTCWPKAMRERLTFLEVVSVADACDEPLRTVQYVSSAEGGLSADTVAAQLKQASRPVLVADSPAQFEEMMIFARETLGIEPAKYQRSADKETRRRAYEGIKHTESEGDGYILVADADVFETSDLSSDLVISGIPDAAGLIRRAGRCNRRADYAVGRMIVIEGDTANISANLADGYRDALSSLTGKETFRSIDWQDFAM